MVVVNLCAYGALQDLDLPYIKDLPQMHTDRGNAPEQSFSRATLM